MSSALAKLFEGILLHRLMQYTETHNTLTENQLGTRPGRQVHDAIYILLSVIQYNLLKKGKPTYVAFLDYSTAFPSVFKVALLSLLQKFNIVGKMWKHLHARFRTVKVRVLHPQIPSSWWVRILRGLPEGSRLSPVLFGVMVADLILQLQIKFPTANIITQTSGQIGQNSVGAASGGNNNLGWRVIVCRRLSTNVNGSERAAGNAQFLPILERRISATAQCREIQSHGVP